MLLSGI